MITAEYLRSILNYDEKLGLFTWKIPPCNRVLIGAEAGTVNQGYIRIQINGKRYFAHRLAWLYVYGKWPILLLDHKDGNTKNNCLTNLREATTHQNQQNQRKCSRSSSSKLIGAHKCGNKWRSNIKLNNKTIHIGTFNTAIDAHQAYVSKKRQLHEFCTI
jgi:hypothetical protein